MCFTVQLSRFSFVYCLATACLLYHFQNPLSTTFFNFLFLYLSCFCCDSVASCDSSYRIPLYFRNVNNKFRFFAKTLTILCPVSAAKRLSPGIYITLVLLLRSLRACSLGVVLVKVARHFYTYQRANHLQHPRFLYIYSLAVYTFDELSQW